MIGSTRQVGVWAYGSPADLRKGFDGLSGLVLRELRGDPLSGDLFLFVNRTRTLAKVLVWDGTGCAFTASAWSRVGLPACGGRGREPRLRLTTSELALFLEGSKLVGKIELSPPVFAREGIAFEATL